jgi:NADH:ubiquinone oxidoreductase subunit 5 (subunit L)/multisubunit Na+/H+ antiporter MnhA subunit
MLVAVIGGLVRLLIQNTSNKIIPEKMKYHWFYKVLYDKYYVDEIYDSIKINQWPVKFL